MKRGKEVRTAKGQPIPPTTSNEIMALMFVMVEHAPGAFRLRLVTNDDLLEDLKKQGALQSFVEDADQLYAEFHNRFKNAQPAKRPN